MQQLLDEVHWLTDELCSFVVGNACFSGGFTVSEQFSVLIYLELPDFIMTKDISDTPRPDIIGWIHQACDFTH